MTDAPKTAIQITVDKDNPDVRLLLGLLDKQDAQLKAAEEMAEAAQAAFEWIEMMEGKGNSATSVILRSTLAAFRKAQEAS